MAGMKLLYSFFRRSKISLRHFNDITRQNDGAQHRIMFGPGRIISSNDLQCVLFGSLREAAGNNHSLEHRYAIHIGITPRRVNLSPNIKRAIIEDLNTNPRIFDVILLVGAFMTFSASDRVFPPRRMFSTRGS